MLGDETWRVGLWDCPLQPAVPPRDGEELRNETAPSVTGRYGAGSCMLEQFTVAPGPSTARSNKVSAADERCQNHAFDSLFQKV